MEVHLENVISIWKKEAKDAESLIILSPYISSPTADEVVKNIDCRKCKIYTLFSWHLFSLKSSSIQTLIKLKRKGCSINYLPGLHAKIFLVPNKIASIGSQNFTLSGQNRKEATTFITDKDKLNEIHEQVLKWTADSKELSLDMLLDMKAAIMDIATEYEQLFEMSDDIRNNIFDNERERKREKSISELSEELSKNVGNIKRSSNTQYGKVIYKHYEGYYGPSDLCTFKISDDCDSFLNWKINDDYYKLQKSMRYLIISEDSGRIGWVRVNKTQFSFVENCLGPCKNFKLNRQLCDVTFKFLWDTESNTNLMIVVTPEGATTHIQCDCWFDLRRVNVNNIYTVSEEIDSKDAYSSFLGRNDLFETIFGGGGKKVKYEPTEACEVSRAMMGWIKNNHDSFSRKIVIKLLSSFEYQDKLTGSQASGFFGFDGTRCSLQLGKVSGKTFLITNKI